MSEQTINYPVQVEELRKCYCEYTGEEPQMKFIEAIAGLMNLAYKCGKEVGKSEEISIKTKDFP